MHKTLLLSSLFMANYNQVLSSTFLNYPFNPYQILTFVFYNSDSSKFSVLGPPAGH